MMDGDAHASGSDSRPLGEPELAGGQFRVNFDDLLPRARIREVALRLFAKHGTKHTTLRMVAASAGVSLGAVVHYFKTKDLLIRAVQESVIDSIRATVVGVGLSDRPVDAIRKRRAAFDRFLAENPAISDFVRVILLEGGPASVQYYGEQLALARSEMRAMVNAGIARPLPDEEIGIVLYQQLTHGPRVLRSVLEEVLGLDLADPEVVVRFREATIDLLTRPLFPPGGTSETGDGIEASLRYGEK